MGVGGKRIAILIPCYNEAPTIGKVVRDYRQAFELQLNVLSLLLRQQGTGLPPVNGPETDTRA